MALEPATSGEFGGYACAEERQADGEGADDPAHLHATLEHEPVEQGQNEDEDRCLGEEGGAAMSGDGEQVEER